MAAIQRPATPYPHFAEITHASTSSYSPSHSINFPMKPVYTPTPPSLLARAASGSLPRIRAPHSPNPSKSRKIELPSSYPNRPSFSPIGRRSTSSQSSIYSYTSISARSSVSSQSSQSSQYHETSEVSEKPLPLTPKITNDMEYSVPDEAYLQPASYPSRPTFKRRDTPRPTARAVETMQENEDGNGMRTERKSTLTSVVDGGKWVILG
ncbi:hypothetical protein M231_06729 [Tremella mesenterica]|uniref:Uncharacterized protein n=1 Tax=Tremella mesenterica TaxID=5217 RepID=A0A4Q1BEY5_TREME|nr:uncharacterized protein TREMEDRAFT_60825 [Tremella mesenterica DSM 1558]EIW70334.1 hypothetical protein TREMEDRAFT_60825 [Tremella mesenterica DSM 1558]RXK36015.1 hypothetical protein M231_06729 [Tremella mesenterica]